MKIQCMLLQHRRKLLVHSVSTTTRHQIVGQNSRLDWEMKEGRWCRSSSLSFCCQLLSFPPQYFNVLLLC